MKFFDVVSGVIAQQTHSSELFPIGSVTMYAGTTIPPEYLLADGSAISRTSYPALFSVIGSMYGEGDGSTTFNLPDCRGLFIRFTNLGRDDQWNDPTAEFRSDRGDGNGGDIVGTKQTDAIKQHFHNTVFYGGPQFLGGRRIRRGNAAANVTTVGINGATASSENRPANKSIYYILRAL